MNQMYLPEGFSAEVVVAEPDVHQPVAFAFDERGRIWVAEAYSYPQKQPAGQGLDKLVIFEDADGSLVVVDTGPWYKLCCPTSQIAKPDVLGAIYRVRRQDAPAPARADARDRALALRAADHLERRELGLSGVDAGGAGDVAGRGASG